LAFWVYVLRCSDGSYYTGHTDDLDLRMAQHSAGAGGDYTCGRRPLTLAFAEALTTRDDAKAAELEIKGWSRAKKEALFARDWDRLRALAVSRQLSVDVAHPSTALRTGGVSDTKVIAPLVLSVVEGPVLSAVEGRVAPAAT
jgi:predicted GIY-YIG superfamily endonuclease